MTDAQPRVDHGVDGNPMARQDLFKKVPGIVELVDGTLLKTADGATLLGRFAGRGVGHGQSAVFEQWLGAGWAAVEMGE
jgi:hypothetical protein